MSGFTSARSNRECLRCPRIAYKGSEIIGGDGTYIPEIFATILGKFSDISRKHSNIGDGFLNMYWIPFIETET